MHDDTSDTTETGAQSRRDTIKFGGTVAAAGLVAGCLGESGGGGDPGGNGPTAATETDTDGENASGADDGATVPYTVSMAPAGEVTFDAVPERWTAYCNGFMDMGVALGVGDGLAGVGGDDRVHDGVYDELPGVDLDRTPIEEHNQVRTKEEFYATDADVHLYDTQMLINWFDWDQGDVDEIRENVGPFVGNLIFRRSDDWHDYEYYTLYEAFEKIATLFQRRDRYAAFKSFHDDYVTRLQDRLPPEGERPEVFLTFEHTAEPETFSPYRLDDRGVSKKQWNDLGARDALADTDVDQLSSSDRTELDYENLLEIDPDVILVRGHEDKTPTEFRDVVLDYMQNHPVGSELTAVQNERVYRGGPLHQGPIHNLFLTERAAKQLYPDEFGDVTTDTQLFDRQRAADIVNGDL